METVRRTAFQGVINIVRFNWHFYVLALSLVAGLLCAAFFLPFPLSWIFFGFVLAIISGTFISLFVSWYVYDHSRLYELNFLKPLQISSSQTLVNVNAGFDETSGILHSKYPDASLAVFDFYDPKKHTEVSIERARKTYPPYPGTKTISTKAIPLRENSADVIFLILAAHEIRNHNERVGFFRQLKNALKEDGKIVVVEHQRDLQNFFAYTIGFFHFFSNAIWKRTFKDSGLNIVSETKHTPFLSIFILQK